VRHRIPRAQRWGTVVLNLPLQNIVGGNVQAHYDQPHKNK
jgi:hypothetical protein